MDVRITAIRPFDSDANVKLAALDVTNEDGDVYNVIVTWESALVLEPVMDSGEVIEIPNWLLLPFPLFDDPDA